MKVYIVFKHVLAFHDDVVVDSVWRTLPGAYERMISLKEGGRIEMHEIEKVNNDNLSN